MDYLQSRKLSMLGEMNDPCTGEVLHSPVLLLFV